MLISSSKYSNIELKFFLISLDPLNDFAKSSIVSSSKLDNASITSPSPIKSVDKINENALNKFFNSSSVQSLESSNNSNSIPPKSIFDNNISIIGVRFVLTNLDDEI